MKIACLLFVLTLPLMAWGACKMAENGKCCTFPFIDNKGVRYNHPAPLPDCRQPYCATKVDEQGHIAEWAFVKAPSITNDCKRKTIRGECCKFPFKEKGGSRENNNCITNYYRDNGIEYCATEVNKDGVMTRWDYCADGPVKTKTGSSCVFPFKWEGKTYYHCGGSISARWCATKVDNCLNLLTWDHCECVKTKGNYCCLFPFKAAYSGWFNKCITSQNPKDFQGPWCAVTVRSDGSFYWREGCADQT